MTVLIQSGINYTREQLTQSITELVLSGFEAKFMYKFFSKKEARAIATVLSLFLATEKPGNLIVAERNKTICGCLYFIDKHENSKLLSHYLKQHFSIIKQIQIWFFFSFLSHQPKEGEQHIDFIAVSPVFRGLGIGRKLICYCKEQCDKNWLTLHVAQDNANAFHLYQSESFEVNKEFNSIIGGSITGIKDWRFMTWQKI